MEVESNQIVKEIFVCSVCKNKYTSKIRVIWHLINVHRNDPAIQNLQNIILKRKNNKLEKKTRNVRRSARCKKPSKELVEDKKEKSQKYNTEYKCDDCNYVTVHLTTYKRHLLTHEKGGRVHKCAHCSFTAIQPYNLQRHLKFVHLIP